MNIVQNITKRWEGFEFVRDYDIALYRLKCLRNDLYHGISSNINAQHYNSVPPVFACRFCIKKGYEQILALANEDGRVALQDINIRKRHDTPLEGTQAHGNAIFDVAWMPNDLKLVTVSGDHSAKLWDVSQSEIKQIDIFQAHLRSVKTAVFRPEDKAIFATGARDGIIMIWDIRARHSAQLKADNCIFNAHSSVSVSNKHRKNRNHLSCTQSITSLGFQDDNSLISCAAGDGVIKVWDLRKNYTVYKRDAMPKHSMYYAGSSLRNGFSSLLICPARITLYASCMDNVIYAYNISSYNTYPVAQFYGHQNSTYYVKTSLSPDGRYLTSGSSDEIAYIWHTKRSGEPIIKLSGHTEEVTCIAWCTVGETKIVTCSDDSCHMIWRIIAENTTENAELEIVGRAEPVSSAISLGNLKTETTPTTHQRYTLTQDHTPGSSDRTPNSTPGSTESNNVYAGHKHRQSNSSSFKRTYTQMTLKGSYSDGKLKTSLSPIHENSETRIKRPHIENRGARRLFSQSTDKTTICDKGYNFDKPSTSSYVPKLETTISESNVSESTISENNVSESTSSENNVSESTSSSISFLPISNLPNFVIDGTAPHLLQISPEKYKERVDWLTKIREKFKDQKSKSSTNKLSSSKVITPAHRSSRSRSMEPKGCKTSASPTPSLLNFFKVNNRECDKNTCPGNSNTLS
ncbi:PREDICTED: protein lethal(2)denticleless [Polistes dominula]|uniref:Protein lethal(2)denticleless n=1 Tax=Polistes dominula TaxID=743375 RepID=A0ABM1JGP4_POLDO|nr:PREDICTED: protein lethal(2)denticleless [Polistes dominula]